jgi:Glycine zipper 2TM domain
VKKTLMATLIAASALTSAPAFADRDHWRHRNHHYDRYDDGPRYRYTDNGIRYWRGDNGRYYCRRSDGTTGLLVGAALGALLGRSVDTYGDRAPGTILGAAAGALLGREVDRGRTRCR